MKRANSNEYFIIKLRVHASAYHLKNWQRNGSSSSHRKHVEACDKHRKFFQSLYEHVTGNKYQDLFLEYSFAMNDCAHEILESDHGIILSRGEAWQTYLIPKNQTKLIEWFVQNIGDIPYKILKRSMLILDFHTPSTQIRDHFRLTPERRAYLENAIKN